MCFKKKKSLPILQDIDCEIVKEKFLHMIQNQIILYKSKNFLFQGRVAIFSVKFFSFISINKFASQK